MRERSTQILRLVCIILAGLLAYQIAQIALHWNPLARVTIPILPTLTETNDVTIASATNSAAGKTNSSDSTNRVPAGSPGTNAPKIASMAKLTNAPSTNEMSNVVSAAQTTNVPSAETAAAAITNVAPAPETAGKTTNLVSNEKLPVVTNASSVDTNLAPPTNALVANSTNPAGTNGGIGKKTAPKHKDAGQMNEAMMAAMNGGPNKPGKKAPPLPPAMQARISRIVESEIFASVIHPMPAALMGIAGKVAFLRTASGQTGLVKEGDSLGELKLIRIGTNRVLVESDSGKKELTMFNGFGGESLLSKTNDVSHESITPTNK